MNKKAELVMRKQQTPHFIEADTSFVPICKIKTNV